MRRTNSLLRASLLRALALVLAWIATSALPEAYPDKPVRLIIPFPPGGSSDIIGREFAHELRLALDVPVFVDNRGGANGIIGANALAMAAPDGYTLVFHILTSHLTNPWVYRNLPYDTVHDFSSITLVGRAGLVFAANPSFPAETIEDLVSLGKTSSGKISIGSFGTASMSHLSIELLKRIAEVQLSHVPYRGSGPAVTATLSAQVPVSVVGLPAALPYIKTGRLRALAVTSARRSFEIPNVPTVAESAGLEGYEAALMYALLAPAHTPPSIIKRVQQAAVFVLQSLDLQRRLHHRGMDEVIGSTSDEMDAYIVTEMEKIRKLVKSAGLMRQ
jgi:tripartite-type tricarboxylate transporter receptor subunit TctC